MFIRHLELDIINADLNLPVQFVRDKSRGHLREQALFFRRRQWLVITAGMPVEGSPFLKGHFVAHLVIPQSKFQIISTKLAKTLKSLAI